MSDLGPQKQNASYAGLLQVPGGITSTLQTVTDGDGNPTGLQLSSTAVSALGIVSSTAQNIYGGSAGQLVYQTGSGTTGFVSTGTTGQLLQSNGLATPTFVSVTASTVGALPTTGGAMTGAIDMNANLITDLATPVASTDAATKGYVDSVATGLQPKTAVTCASTANIATLSGLLTVDGIAVTAGQRVLVKDQSTAANNGIYVASASAWARATDADTWSELVGAAVFVSSGTANANTTWVTNIPSTGTIGVTAITFVQFSAAQNYTAGTGLALAGSQFSLITPVAIANGGTNSTATPTAGAVAYGTGSAIGYTSAGSAGQLLQSNGSSAPTFATVNVSTLGALTSSVNPSFTGTYLSGSVTRPVTDMFGDIRSVADFAPTNALGDSSYDWTSAIQKAVNSLTGNGGSVYFPPSSTSYLVNGTVNIPLNYVLLHGNGNILYRTKGNDGTFFNVSGTLVTIQDFVMYGCASLNAWYFGNVATTSALPVPPPATPIPGQIPSYNVDADGYLYQYIDGSYVKTTSGSNYAITTTQAQSNVTIRNCYLRGVGSGISISGVYFLLDGCAINDYQPRTGVAYRINHNSSGPDPTGSIASCECDNSANGVGYAGILVNGNNTIQVSDSEIQHNVVGLFFAPPSSVSNVNSCFFVDTYFDSNFYAGVRFSGQDSPSCAFNQMQFTNCWFSSGDNPLASPTGVIIDSGVSANEFTFNGCLIGGNVNGFYVGNNSAGSNKIRGLTLSACSFEGNSNTDLSIGENNERFIITGCWFEGGGPNCVYINGGCNNYIITNNIIAKLTDLGGSNRVVSENIINSGSRQNGLGYQVPQIVTGSRSLNTRYQNQSPVPICVSVTAGASGSTGDTLGAWLDWGTGEQYIIGTQTPAKQYVSITFMVPPGVYYRVRGYGYYIDIIAIWSEYGLGVAA